MSYKSSVCFKRDGSPKSTYESELEAIQGAEYANKVYQNNLTPYLCSICSEWHLSPANRVTQSIKCKHCDDSRGQMKDLYVTQEDAQKRADILYDEKGVVLNIYSCPYSSGWHLTKRGT